MPRHTTNTLLIVTIALGSLCVRPTRAAADPHTEARNHFEAGTTAFEQRRFADAALEFERAYALEPAWQVLYNLGTVYAALGRPVEAIETFERYLKLAGPDLDPIRKREVAAEIEHQRAKAGWLDVRVNRPGAAVRIDGHSAGTTPLTAAVLLAVGVHAVEVSHGEQRFERRDVRVLPAKRTTIEVDFPALPGAATRPADAAHTKNLKPRQLGGPQRLMGWIFGVPGLLALAGGVTGLTQTKDVDDVETQRHISFVALGAGGALFVAGVLSYVFAPSGTAAPETQLSALQVSGWASGNSAGLVLKRSW